MSGFRPRLVFSRPVPVAPVNADRFRLLVLPHLDAAYSYARYLARDPTAAEDIVQDAFLRAFRGFGSCRGNEKAWLLTIVRNCFIDWANAHRRTPPELEVETVDGEHPESILQRRQDAEAVRATVEALPEPFREALVLRELEELPYKDIAALTGAPIGTVMSRLARARAMLATMLLAREDEGSAA
jgi:RNA polymerase sigma-70 factor (ECF subfamily)